MPPDQIGATRFKILAFLMAHRGRRPPTIAEIADYAEVASKGGVRAHLVALRKAGLVTWEAADGRGGSKCRTLRATCVFILARFL